MKENNSSLLTNQSGFTLVEVLISIVLMAFVALTTYQITDSSINTKENVTKEDREIMQVLTMLNRMDADFQESYSPLFFDAQASRSASVDDSANGGNYSNDINYFEGNKNFYAKTKAGHLIPFYLAEEKGTLQFLSTAHRRRVEGKKESRFAWIKYSLRSSAQNQDSDSEEEKRGENELVRQSFAGDIYNKEIDWEKVPAQVVIQNIKELEFQFWDERTKKFTANINDLNENRYNIRAVKVVFTWIDPDKNEQKFEKNFRTLWPYFNPKQDEMLNNSSNPSNPFDTSNSGNNNNANGAGNPDDDGGIVQ